MPFENPFGTPTAPNQEDAVEGDTQLPVVESDEIVREASEAKAAAPEIENVDAQPRIGMPIPRNRLFDQIQKRDAAAQTQQGGPEQAD